MQGRPQSTEDDSSLSPSPPLLSKRHSEALLNVEIEHSTGYSDLCSSMNRLPASPLGSERTGGRGASPGRRAAAAALSSEQQQQRSTITE